MPIFPRASIRYNLVAYQFQAIDKIRFREGPSQATAERFSRHPLSQGSRDPHDGCVGYELFLTKLSAIIPSIKADAIQLIEEIMP
ncbi:6558_t:CDS:2 [Funneliformis caledonium]|uniref:6558_t:CDS:1 n=1 Tax=Funneliformis caledonium TaxID=1117310 RepID=A0A9N8WBZ4_9GLOM|nr:6558_t:CDS:2 [Funneliformis caledonium]